MSKGQGRSTKPCFFNCVKRTRSARIHASLFLAHQQKTKSRILLSNTTRIYIKTQMCVSQKSYYNRRRNRSIPSMSATFLLQKSIAFPRACRRAALPHGTSSRHFQGETIAPFFVSAQDRAGSHVTFLESERRELFLRLP